MVETRLLFLRKHTLLVLILMFFSLWSFSQRQMESYGSWNCYQKKIHEKPFLQQKSLNSPKHSFDVLKYTLNLNLYNCYTTPYPHSFSGTVTIRFRVDTALNIILLNAVNSSIVIDSVSIAGISFLHTGDILTVTLDRTYNAGEIAEVMIAYHHLNVYDSFFTGGGIAFTDCEPEGARDWFPCWDKPSDKALLDFTAKVPDNVLLASNGRLQDSIHIADTIYYHWISRDPVATYLTVITSKVGYNLDILYWPMLSSPTTLVPIRYYYNAGEDPTPSESIILDMTDFYSNKFCEHPFEKNGFATLDAQFIWGGMENQTLISFCPDCWDEYLTAHEFAHQWFGDMITCGTWSDIWLNEGFATYIEALWSEHAYSYYQYKSDIDYYANYYLSHNPGWAIVNPNWAITTPPQNELFNYAVTYCKGACVLHMFRYTVGDSLFFASLKEYAGDTTNFKYKSAVIPDFVSKINQVCGQNLEWYFNEWLSQPNHPVYHNEYNIANIGGGNWTVNFLANQVQTNTGFFKMPIELLINFSGGSDTVVKIMNSQNNEIFSFTFNKQPINLIFDPDNQIVLKQASTVLGFNNNNILSSSIILYQNNPNPFTGKTTIGLELPSSDKVRIMIYNDFAQPVAEVFNGQMNRGKHEVEIDAKNLAPGIYYYSLETSSEKKMRKMVILK